MDDRTWPLLIGALLRGEELSAADTAWAMGEIMAGAATPAQIAGFAIALRAKGETPGEIAGLVETMLANAARVELPEELRTSAVDVVGTGGDGSHTVNISTMAAIVAAGAGARVVKHGNRAASSSCGSADLLEAPGLPLDLGPHDVAYCVTEAGIGFCFAPRFHPGFRHVAMPRRELGVPTAFNFLGPLTNPAQPTAAAVGCSDLAMAPVMAEVFARRGDSVLLVRGEDGLDEFTTTAATRIWAVSGGTVTQTMINAEDLGLPRVKASELRGADAAFNAEVARQVFAGAPGAVRDAVLLNAAGALVARDGWGGTGSTGSAGGAGSVGDLASALRAGIAPAAEAVDSGAAADTLRRWIAVARSRSTAE
jgi:anthranilate phosphoribosyltransferase